MSIEVKKQAYGGPEDGAMLPEAPEGMLAIPVSGENRYAIYEDTGLRYVFKGIETAVPLSDEELEECD
jgi:hypothetical protein